TAPAPPQRYTLSLHDALPISLQRQQIAGRVVIDPRQVVGERRRPRRPAPAREVGTLQPIEGIISGGEEHVAISLLCRRRARVVRSEEHTSELQSRFDLVCRLL